jgi:alpha-D-xyloside xylohydrolase
MVRALFVEYPDDPGSWLVDNEYLFGSDMLVAPLFEETTLRDVYLPPGRWIDYQTGKTYTGGWHAIETGKIPVVILVQEGSVIPHIKLAQSTKFMDWSELNLMTFPDASGHATGLVYLPGGERIEQLAVEYKEEKLSLTTDPFNGKVKWNLGLKKD